LVTLYDTGGRQVFKSITNTGILKTTGLDNSIIFYRITNHNKTYSGKITSFN
jgi:hypothetical protein